MGTLKKDMAKSAAGCVFARGPRPVVPHGYALSVLRLWEARSVPCPLPHPSWHVGKVRVVFG